MNVLVTGTAGFIGSHVAAALMKRGEHVTGLDNFDDHYDPARKRANVARLMSNPHFTLHEADVRNTEGMKRICNAGKFDGVIHLAAMTGGHYSVEHGPLYADINVHGTVNMLEAARLAGIPHFVFASTSSVYGRTGLIPFREDDPLGHPLAPYPATKIAGEVMGHAYHNLFGISFTALRIFSVYGPCGRPDMMSYHIVDCIVHERKFPLYEGGEMYRDWTYISDIVSGVLSALDRRMGYQAINLGRGEPVRMSNFVQLVERMVQKQAWTTTLPAPPSEIPITYADVTKARDLLDYRPTVSVAEGMAHFWEWYQSEILQCE
ncbi:MAG TPA: NAD-dependent epimerase/dehydratase family protein [Chloroflexi bacterium]|nr:NAD-dependent epimerase/dehydratase family protein [Chloroflexota bacterium]